MKRLLLVISSVPLMLYSIVCAGQDSSHRISILISPALFVPVSVAVQGGVQVTLNKRWSVLVEAAIPTFHPDNTPYETINYWRADFEIKYRLSKTNKNKTYLGFHNSYLFRELTDLEQGRYYTKSETFAYQNTIIKSPVLASAIKLGIELSAGRRTFFDCFAGLGLRTIFTSYRSQSALVTSIPPEKGGFLNYDDAWMYNYTLVRPHVTAGLRFGIRL